MKKFFNEYNIKVSEEQLNLFEKYYQLLIHYNNAFNITAITEREDVYKKHFVDSVIGVDRICGKNLIDVGSGGGFPALPIKIMRDDLNVTMLEATGKKCEFLKTVVKELGLNNVQVVNGRAEDIAKDSNYRENFDVCTARAVARLNTLTEYCLPFVKVGGTFISLKGDVLDEANEAQNAINILGGKVDNIDYYQLDGAKRALVYIKKVKNTPAKYPRGNGKERKSPL